MNPREPTKDYAAHDDELLTSARRQWTPDSTRAARVLALTQQALAADSLGPESEFAAGSGDQAGVGQLREVLWHAPGRVVRLTAATLLSAATGLVGYGLGVWQAPSDGAVHATASQVQVRVPQEAAPVAPSDAGVAATKVGVEPAPLDARPQPAESSAVVAQGKARSRAKRRAAPSRRSGQGPAQQLAVDSAGKSAEAVLTHELRMVKQVEAALRARAYNLVLRLLYDLDRDIPEGQLLEERAAAFLLARCGLGLGAPQRMVAEFAEVYPESMYLERIRNACGQVVETNINGLDGARTPKQ